MRYVKLGAYGLLYGLREGAIFLAMLLTGLSDLCGSGLRRLRD